ncbi:MAG: hypothetical protein HON94_09770 [Methylococcales bacterium]|nr:hypothetical protein [Methylococcales bacterium]MBT7408496.1 hypothetical protein [Methylococcales bacterium]
MNSFIFNAWTLFVKPDDFFKNIKQASQTKYIVIASFLYGIAHTLGRIDKHLLNEEFNRARPGWEILSPYIMESWVNLWFFLVIVGLFAGIIAWYLGGWWYRIRLQWCGQKITDKRLARVIYIYSQLVITLPSIACLLIQTVIYSHYRDATNSDHWLFVILSIFPFWSCWVSYCGCTTVFKLEKKLAILWFVILPSMVYLSMQTLLIGLLKQYATGSFNAFH